MCFISSQGDRISMDRQLLRHKKTISRLPRYQRKTLTKCIYIVNIGSNDYINNYLLYDIYNTSQMYTTYQYAEVLIQQYSKQLRVHTFTLLSSFTTLLVLFFLTFALLIVIFPSGVKGTHDFIFSYHNKISFIGIEKCLNVRIIVL